MTVLLWLLLFNHENEICTEIFHEKEKQEKRFL